MQCIYLPNTATNEEVDLPAELNDEMLDIIYVQEDVNYGSPIWMKFLSKYRYTQIHMRTSLNVLLDIDRVY